MLKKLLVKLLGPGLLSKALGSFVRHGLTALSAILVGANLDPVLVASWIAQSNQLAVGLIGLAVAYVMSIVNKLD